MAADLPKVVFSRRPDFQSTIATCSRGGRLMDPNPFLCPLVRPIRGTHWFEPPTPRSRTAADFP